MLLTAILNPIFNHKGLTVLFYLKRNPVTLESVAYGAASGVMLGSVLLIFSCFNRIITDDKILCCSGRIIPSLAVVLSMALRFVPLFTTQAKKIALAQRCSDGDPASKSIVKRAKSGLFIFSALITWALESAVTTADSMRARGFGLHPRSFYTDFRFDGRDTVVSLFLAAGIAIFGTAAGCGKITVTYFPKFRMNPASPLFIAACIAYAPDAADTCNYEHQGVRCMALLEIKNLNFTYPEAAQPALSGINLEIQPGEFVLICGASGCGKSTLLRQCKPALSQHGEKSGAIYFNGKAIEELSFREQSEKIGFVMQDPEMQIVTDKVRHELAFGLESLGTDNRKMRVRIAEMASFFGIRDWFDSPVSAVRRTEAAALSCCGHGYAAAASAFG